MNKKPGLGFLRLLNCLFHRTNMWRHQFFCNHISSTASAFLRHLLQVELMKRSSNRWGPVPCLSRTGEGQQAESGQNLVQTQGTWAEKMLCVGNGAGWWLLIFHKYATGDKTQTLSRCHRTVKLLDVKRGGMNFDAVCILICCFLFTSDNLISPTEPCSYFQGSILVIFYHGYIPHHVGTQLPFPCGGNNVNWHLW